MKWGSNLVLSNQKLRHILFKMRTMSIIATSFIAALRSLVPMIEPAHAWIYTKPIAPPFHNYRFHRMHHRNHLRYHHPTEHDHSEDENIIRVGAVSNMNDKHEKDDTKSKSLSKLETDTLKSNYRYKPPQFSDAFQKHMQEIKETFPVNDDDGVDCTGEPSIDPSRMVMDDGLDSEFLSDSYF